MIDTLITGAAELFDGREVHADWALGLHEGLVAYIGPAAGAPPARETLDAQGGLITPGLIDPHTHIVYGGDRAGEYARRATGTSYLEIAAEGGGIAATVRATRDADLEALVALARPRLQALLASGVTTAEVKSGYGLDLESELKILRAVEVLDAEQPIDLVPTFLGAHTVPPGVDRADYVNLVCEQMLPAVAEVGLAEFCDVFVERGAFTIAEAERVLSAGLVHGLQPKLHADQLSPGGGAELAARMDATSADHLEYISDVGVESLCATKTVAVLLPGAALFLGTDERAPARALIEAGVPVALSTDCNPGTCTTPNLLLILTLGMSRLGMSPLEVLQAVTSHAAQAIRRQKVAGTLAEGRPADVAVFDVPSHRHLPYLFGMPHTRWVLKGGALVYGS